MKQLVDSSIIIDLIHQDLKHAQMMETLKIAGFYNDEYYLDLATIIAKLMGNESGEASDQWAKLYISFLEQIPIDNKLELAEECYLFLKACNEIEQRCKKVNT